MKLKSPSSLLLSTGGIFLLLSLLCSSKADLTYYLYAEEEEQTNQEEASVMVLRSIGSLPLDQSTFTTAGDACPDSVAEAGGVNPKFLCAGAAHPAKASANATSFQAAFFPILPVEALKSDEDGGDDNSFFPFKFSAFSRSRGTPSGLLTWRNALVVNMDVATNEDQPQFLDAVSMGPDTSSNAHNSELLASYEDGAVLGEWHLLTTKGGDLVEGGKISLLKGKPPSTTHKSQQDDEVDDINSTGTNGAALATTNDAAFTPTEEPQIHSCQSITQVLCDDENNDRYGTLCSLTMQVGLDQMLNYSNGNLFTLFAPTNDGFSRAFIGRSPALLSGHDLTKLILNHLIVSETTETSQSAMLGANPAQQALKYENMVCGSKNEMASGQIAKIGCDSNAEVAFVMGAGNGGSSAYSRPKFLQVDQPTCNGVIHTVDFVVLPTSQQLIHQHVHEAATVNVGESATTNLDSSSNSNAATSAADSNIPQIPVSFDSKTNQLDQSEIMSFFAQTKQDLLEESGPMISSPTLISTTPLQSAETSSSTATSVVEEEPEPAEPETTSTDGTIGTEPETVYIGTEPERKENPLNGVDTKSEGFHSFFQRNRPGNLRRR